MTGDVPTAGSAPAPALALELLRELSAGLRGAVVLGADGAPLAGDAALAEPARRLLAAAAPGAATVRERAADGDWLLAARRADGLALAARVAARGLVELAEHDLRAVLSDLGSARMP
jgi:hypothetical protein